LSPRVLHHVMLGLPETGKTTFLAALWQVLRSGDVGEGLELAILHGNREYLNKIADQWSRCEALGRTSLSSPEPVTLRVRDRDMGELAELAIPDMSGESFEVQWDLRECSLDYARLAEKASGILLFVHPEVTKETDSIAQANEVLGDWAPEARTEAGCENRPDLPWEARKVPTQVKMVELLQFLALLAPSQLRVAVIVSAWDLVTEHRRPEEWLERRLPLLHQYLQANQESISWQAYGVSAQGGRLEDADRLLEEQVAAKRIQIVGPGAAPHDITAPVRWLMSGVDGTPGTRNVPVSGRR